MPLLYRSPNVRIDNADWYVSVEQSKGGVPLRRFRFRMVGETKWQSVVSWRGPLPKKLSDRLRYYQRSINVALVGAGAPLVSTKRLTPFGQIKRDVKMRVRAIERVAA